MPITMSFGSDANRTRSSGAQSPVAAGGGYAPMWSTFEVVLEDGTVRAPDVPEASPALKKGLLSAMMRRRGQPSGSGSQPPVILKAHHVVGKKELSSPAGVVLFRELATLAIADDKNNRVALLDLQSGAPKGTITGDTTHSLIGPRGVAVDEANGVVHVVAFGENKVRAYALGGAEASMTLLRSSSGKDDSKLKYPQACVLLGGRLHVVDSDNHRIVQFEASDLSFCSAFGSRGSAPGEYKTPRGLCALPCESNDQLLVADTRNDRIVRVNTSGDVLGVIGFSGTKAGCLREPVGIAASPHAIYVSEEGNQRVQVLSHSGVPMQVLSFGRVASVRHVGGICASGGFVCVVTGDKVRVYNEVLQGAISA